MYLGKQGVWTVCRQRQHSLSRQQIAGDETEDCLESLVPFIFSSSLLLFLPSRSLYSQPADRHGQRCKQL